MARTVLLCCALFALVAFSGVTAQSFKSATFTDKELRVSGDSKHSSYDATFPTKECTRACKETCKDETKEVCEPVTIKKCKKTPQEVQTCHDEEVTKMVKKCKNSCDDDKKVEVTMEKSEYGKQSIKVHQSGGRKLKATLTKGLSNLVMGMTGAGAVSKPLGAQVCKEVCQDVEETKTEEVCDKKTVMKEECKEVEEEKCEDVTKPYCTSECLVTCVPKVASAIAGAAGVAAVSALTSSHPGEMAAKLILGGLKHLG